MDRKEKEYKSTLTSPSTSYTTSTSLAPSRLVTGTGVLVRFRRGTEGEDSGRKGLSCELVPGDLIGSLPRQGSEIHD